ncbi:MAG: glycosyltransferase [Thermoguttaceae bacterium]|nr:glycosyltransferase [Thermoguttaceae bacterium]
MSKISAALCITELEIGGAEKAFTELATGLNPARFSPAVYVLRGEEYHSGKPSFLPVLRQRGIPVFFLDVGGPFTFARGVRRLARLLKEQKADVFLSFMFHANLLGRLAARRAKVGRVFSGIRVADREHRLHLALDRLTSRLVDRYLCVSRSAADFLERTEKIPAGKIAVIPNGVRPPEALSPPSGTAEKRILFVGRLVWQKGLDWLLSFADEWLGAPEAQGWSFAIVGDGPQKRELEKMIARLAPETARRIEFLGWRADAAQLLARAGLFLFPSRYEGMPNALLEAAAAGRAVLSSTCDGAEEILGRAGAPQTFAFGDKDEFLSKFRALLASDAARAELGRANADRAREEFSVEKMIARYEAEFLSET